MRGELAAAIEAQAERRREIYAAVPRWPFFALAVACVVAAVAMQHAAPLLAPFAYAALALFHASRRAQAAAKHRLAGPALRFWSPTLRYDAGDCVAEESFRRSARFSERWNAYGGEDLVAGRVGATEFQLSELSVRRERGGDKSDVVVFRGLFVVADFHKSFQGRTRVFPDTAEQALGAFGRALQKLDHAAGCSLVELESPAFEQHFAVYASDPVEARYILSPSLMERILAFRLRTGRPLRIAFAEERLYLALPSEVDLFERIPASLADA